MAPKLSFETANNGDKLPEITRHITQEEIWQHAVTSFDVNPVHVHPEWCKKARVFGLESTVMHGSLDVLSYQHGYYGLGLSGGGHVEEDRHQAAQAGAAGLDANAGRRNNRETPYQRREKLRRRRGIRKNAG